MSCTNQSKTVGDKIGGGVPGAGQSVNMGSAAQPARLEEMKVLPVGGDTPSRMFAMLSEQEREEYNSWTNRVRSVYPQDRHGKDFESPSWYPAFEAVLNEKWTGSGDENRPARWREMVNMPVDEIDTWSLENLLIPREYTELEQWGDASVQAEEIAAEEAYSYIPDDRPAVRYPSPPKWWREFERIRGEKESELNKIVRKQQASEERDNPPPF